MKTKPKAEDKEQSSRFIETAKKLEADESGKAFDKVVGAVLPVTRKDSRKSRRSS
jgi:hypothetical protein